MKKLLILGVSGSIGQQCCEVVQEHSDLFQITAVSVGVNVAVLSRIIEDYQPQYICVASEQDYKNFKKLYPQINWSFGAAGLSEIVRVADYDILVNALSGFAGVVPTIEAVKRKKDIALANKESLVVAGNLINKLNKQNKVKIHPIDSEHSAIWQCLQGNELKAVKRVIITASGGSFRDLDREQLKTVTVNEALNHPNWSMGPRITIDSATMMNKCFEVVEAKHLFNLKSQQIDVVIHPQSMVHSLVEFCDGSLVAQLGNPDMRIAIQYALSYPERLQLRQKADFHLTNLDFKVLDEKRFPFIKLAYRIIKEGDTLGCIVNAADEEAVSAFIKGRISFLEIEALVFEAVKIFNKKKAVSLESLIKLDQEVRTFIINRISKMELNN